MATPAPDTPEDLVSFDPRADYESPDGSFEMHHQDGLPWFEATIPPRLHSCVAQTWAWEHKTSLIERCACGAINLDHTGWLDRNSRRREEKAAQGGWRRWLSF